MRRHRRITALFVSLLLANLVGIGSGFACVMPAMESAPAGATVAGRDIGNDMAGMAMADMTAPASDAPAEHHDVSCNFPWAPDACQSMAPCAPMALASMSSPQRSTGGAASDRTRLVVIAPPSETRTPDIPPPRA